MAVEKKLEWAEGTELIGRGDGAHCISLCSQFSSLVFYIEGCGR